MGRVAVLLRVCVLVLLSCESHLASVAAAPSSVLQPGPEPIPGARRELMMQEDISNNTTAETPSTSSLPSLSLLNPETVRRMGAAFANAADVMRRLPDHKKETLQAVKNEVLRFWFPQLWAAKDSQPAADANIASLLQDPKYQASQFSLLYGVVMAFTVIVSIFLAAIYGFYFYGRWKDDTIDIRGAEVGKKFKIYWTVKIAIELLFLFVGFILTQLPLLGSGFAEGLGWGAEIPDGQPTNFFRFRFWADFQLSWFGFLTVLVQTPIINYRLGYQRRFVNNLLIIMLGTTIAQHIVCATLDLYTNDATRNDLGDTHMYWFASQVYWCSFFLTLIIIIRGGGSVADDSCDIVKNHRSKWEVDLGDGCMATVFLEVMESSHRWRSVYSCVRRTGGSKSTGDGIVFGTRYGVVKEETTSMGMLRDLINEEGWKLQNHDHYYVGEPDMDPIVDHFLYANVLVGELIEHGPAAKQSDHKAKHIMIIQEDCQRIHVMLRQKLEGGVRETTVHPGTRIQGSCGVGFRRTGEVCAGAFPDEIEEEADETPMDVSQWSYEQMMNNGTLKGKCSQPEHTSWAEGECVCKYGVVPIRCSDQRNKNFVSCADWCRALGDAAPPNEIVIAELGGIEKAYKPNWVDAPLYINKPVELVSMFSPTHPRNELEVVSSRPNLRTDGVEELLEWKWGETVPSFFRIRFRYHGARPLRFTVVFRDPFGVLTRYDYVQTYCNFEEWSKRLTGGNGVGQYIVADRAYRVTEEGVTVNVACVLDPTIESSIHCRNGVFDDKKVLEACPASYQVEDIISPGKCPLGFKQFNYGRMCCMGTVLPHTEMGQHACTADPKKHKYKIVPCTWPQGCADGEPDKF